ncbi:Uncharacterised protein [Klebsiella pneumoniae]|nr:Uncharacterised protein [Klebsiella pneumoniae]
MTSRKRPVPAAHLSFIRKSLRLPPASSWITLLSWPPISITVRVSGAQQAGAEAVTRDLRHLLIGKIHQLAAIAGEG